MAKTESNKRLILILGGKGGTGKTLFCRVLYYYLIKAKVSCKAYDADIENPEFYEYHTKLSNPVEPLNFLAIEDAKTLFTSLHDKKPDVALVDMPGASGAGTRDQLELFGVFDIIKDLGYRLTLATVMNNTFNPINSLDAMLKFCGNQSDYVAVKSQLYNQGSLTYKRWEESQTRKLLQSTKGLEIDLPVLEASVFDVIHELNLSFFDIGKLPFGDRILADSFLARTLPELQRAGEYLGFPVAAAKTTSAKGSDAKGAEAKTTDPGKALPELVASAPAS
jgi:hypothetical protein